MRACFLLVGGWVGVACVHTCLHVCSTAQQLNNKNNISYLFNQNNLCKCYKGKRQFDTVSTYSLQENTLLKVPHIRTSGLQ